MTLRIKEPCPPRVWYDTSRKIAKSRFRAVAGVGRGMIMGVSWVGGVPAVNSGGARPYAERGALRHLNQCIL
jgi:hypothetical protein